MKITGFKTHDVRFPTSLHKDGSDAMNKDSDYSAAVIILQTDGELEGHGLTFTLGRGNEICEVAIQAIAPKLVGLTVEDLIADMGKTWKLLTYDSQLRWIGPEKGAIHLATAAVVNAVWDLYAKIEKKPLWRLISDFTPEQLVSIIDFRYIDDALTPEEALAILKAQEPTKAARIAEMEQNGFPAYTTSAGWLGYSDEKVRALCEEARDKFGFSVFKQKVGANQEDDIKRARLIREVVGYENATLMMDANQVWGVKQAIDWMQPLLEFKPKWIEEPTSPDDILGHAAIRKALYPATGVATGEHVQNRMIFKQMLQANAIDFVQIDSCRLGGVNEVVAVMLLAKKFGKPVCPHAGGVGLCEHVQHLSILDYVCIAGDLTDRVCEFVDHLHEHFVDPCIVKGGKYVAPSLPGYSTELHADSITQWSWPNGPSWVQLRAEGKI
ncbi:Mandelate racemase/muconate lactonizing protein [Entophlyctis luteolus]|nr:Mandelate racemase/muconate lactonizing protein [Entophlyctis luteolus]KAJ3387370.1 Mandelate racemase/muconate lactonizing protein [Entophlyctis sp. JEL0112]